jgi:hypothetical protein
MQKVIHSRAYSWNQNVQCLLATTRQSGKSACFRYSIKVDILLANGQIISAMPTNHFQPGRYRHIKGTHYFAYGTAIHTETKEIMVIYAPLPSSGDVYVRPLSMFTESVMTDQGSQPRFAYIGGTSDEC